MVTASPDDVRDVINVSSAEEALAIKGQTVESPEWTMETLYHCSACNYYSKQKPVEVHLG